MFGVGKVEPAPGVPFGPLVAMGRDAAGVFDYAGQVQQFQVMKVVLRLVNSFPGPPDPGSR